MLSCMLLFLFVTYAINTAQLVYYLRTKEFYSFSTVEEFHLLGFTMALIINALLPALLEEILYRGLYRDTFRNHNKFIAIFIPSLVFASLHSNISGDCCDRSLSAIPAPWSSCKMNRL